MSLASSTYGPSPAKALLPPAAYLFGTPPYEVRSSGPGRGFGLFATRHIEAFQSILIEAPLILLQPHEEFAELYEHFSKLSPEAKARYLELSHHCSPERQAVITRKLTSRRPPPKDQHEFLLMTKVVHIMQTNAFNVDLHDGRGKNHRGLFHTVSRINHSCMPTCHVMFYPPERSDSVPHLHLYTICDINPGDEITITYFELLWPREKRQAMMKNWGFECTCPVCDLSPDNRSRQLVEEQKRIDVDAWMNASQTLRDGNKKPSHDWLELVDAGYEQIETCLSDPHLRPALPELYLRIAMLEMLAGPFRDVETEEDKHPVLSYEKAALWEARLTGPESTDTKRRLDTVAEVFSVFAKQKLKAFVKVEDGELCVGYRTA